MYDNNSTDATALIASHAGAVVRHESHKEKVMSFRRMFREIDAECYIMVDGGRHLSCMLWRRNGTEGIRHASHMVIGDRLSSVTMRKNKRAFHNVGNDLVRFLVNKLFHANIPDIMTGYRTAMNLSKHFQYYQRDLK